MESPAKGVFDAHDFLAKVGVGKTILKFQKNQTVFTQGETADTVYYVQQGKQTGHEGHPPRPACVFRGVRGLSSDPQQPD
jgi:hypothetical protein